MKQKQRNADEPSVGVGNRELQLVEHQTQSCGKVSSGQTKLIKREKDRFPLSKCIILCSELIWKLLRAIRKYTIKKGFFLEILDYFLSKKFSLVI
ncbi:Zinc finger protein 626, partial [Araneus ventricosus]